MQQTFKKGMILLTVILMDILSGAEVDLFVPSFPELKRLFNLSPAWLEALLSINFIGFCISLFLVGSLADRYGRKPILLLGLMFFIVGSLLCLWEGSYNFMLFGRFLQGVGVAAPSIISFLIIADSYPLKQQQYLMGILNGFINIAIATAPVVGSYITLYFRWQGNFIALLLLGLLTFIMSILFIPKFELPKHKETLSFSGYVPIFKLKPLMLLIVSMVFLCTPYWLFLGMSPILYMEDLGVSLLHYGYYQGAWALIFAMGSIFFGLMINKFDPKKMLYISAYTCVIGLIIIAWITIIDCRDPLLITLAFLPFSISTIIPFILLYPISMEYLPGAKGKVSAIFRGAILILTAIGIELAGYYYVGSFQNIGIIITGLIIVGLSSLFLVLRNHEIMKFTRK